MLRREYTAATNRPVNGTFATSSLANERLVSRPGRHDSTAAHFTRTSFMIRPETFQSCT